MPRIYKMLKANKPQLTHDFKVKLVLDNQSQDLVFMEKAYNRLMLQLKTNLKNGAIQLVVEIGQTTKKNDMVYTSSDKFKYLADLNDKLNILTEKFKLDFE